MNINKLNNNTINFLRDSAIQFENKNLSMAYELMSIAHYARPEGPFIQKKLESYKKKLRSTSEKERYLQEMINTGSLVFLPIGFRCHTMIRFKEKVRINQKSTVFTNGFFPPDSIISVFKNPKFSLEFSDPKTHAVCIKHEHYEDPELGIGIKFNKTTYDYINSIATDKNTKEINKYLDSTYGYYTLVKEHGFVLAHYNWHKHASQTKSKGIYNPKDNLQNINDIMNRRVARMIDECNNAKYIVCLYYENQGYNFMMIDNQIHYLNKYNKIMLLLEEMFTAKIILMNVSNIVSANEIIKLLR